MRRPSRRDRRVISAAVSALLAAIGIQGGSFSSAAPVRPGPHVVLDGTLGKSGPLQPVLGNYNITADLGQLKGANLFHSFTRLDLTFGESATFSGPASVQNVIARVTGGAQSSIDGTLRCTIAGANFYLINPSGVVFGPNAQLDVKGSFAVTTASAIKLADGGVVNAINPSASVLTTAAPAAFGFLTPSPPAITLTGIGNKQPMLAVPAGKVLSLVGGPVTLDSSQLSAPGGRVNVVAVASAGDVAFDATNLDSAITLPAGTTRADISMTFATLLADGDGGGRISLRGNNLMLQNSTLSAQTLGATNGRGIDIDATGQLSLAGTQLLAGTSGLGNAGSVSITAGSMLIDSSGASAGIVTDSNTQNGPAGNAGAIQITTASLQAIDTGNASTFNTLSISAQGAVPGAVNINATTIKLDGSPATVLPGSSPGQFLFLPPNVITDGTVGPAMSLSGLVVQVDSSLGKLVGNNLFQSFSLFNVPAGDTVEFNGPANVANVIARVTGNSPSQIDGTIGCTINGASLFLINPAGVVFSSTSSLNVQGSFAATTADLIRFSDGGQFNARTPGNTVFSAASPISFGFSGAAAGMISVQGDNEGTPANLAVPAGATLALVGGSIQLDQAQLSAPSGRINLVGVSGAGDVPIALGRDDSLALPAGLARAPVSISNQSVIDVTGDGGRISIRGSDIVLLESTLSAPTDTAAGRGIDIDASGKFSFTGSLITAGTNGSTGTGQGASVAITASSIVIDGRDFTLPNEGIDTSSTGNGSAGNITLQAASVQVFGNPSLVFAASSATHNGQFTINSPAFTLDGSSVALLSIPDGTFQLVSTGAVVLDGSMGLGGALTGPSYVIDTALGMGKVAGPNLFESFSQLSLGTYDSLTINGPSSVKNVLVRITGSAPANINGEFVVNIPGANLFVMSAAGVSLNSSVNLVLDGALTITSANSILFAGGGRFDAVPSAAPLPSGANVSGFEFTSAAPAAITLNATSSFSSNGATAVSLIGGNVTLSLQAGQAVTVGQCNLVAVAAPGQVLFDPTDPQSSPDVSAIARFGDVQIAGGAFNPFQGAPALTSSGPLFIRGNNLTLSSANVTCSQADIALTASLHVSNDSMITATGNISIAAGAVALDSQSGLDGTISANGDITINAASLTAGDSVKAQIFSAGMMGSPAGLVRIIVNGQVAGGTGSLILDGTLGPSGAVSGPDYVLGPAQGSLLGTNLFESLSRFDLASAERLTLNGPSTVQNILVRVTGGPAEVDGLVRSNIAGARVYFIDPSGITFGSGADVNIGAGSFLASTASYLQLGSAGRFDAGNPHGSTLTADAPSALGFGASPAAITLQNASLTAQGLSLIGGSLQFANSTLSGQTTYLAAPPANAVVTLNPADGISPMGLTSSAAFGDISLSTVTAGVLSITGGNVMLTAVDTSNVFGNISVMGQNLTLSNVTGGDLTLRGQSLTMNGGTVGGIDASITGDIQSTGTTVNGDAISMNAANITLQNFTANPSSATFAATGNLSITGSAITLSQLAVTAASVTLDSSTVVMTSDTAGTKNDIQIQSSALTLQNNASISTNTSAAMVGGDIQLNISGMLAVTGGSSIATAGGISGTDAAGSIYITAHDVLLDSGSITTVSGNAGPGGTIALTAANSLTLRNGGQILAANQDGTAGAIQITAGQLSIDATTPFVNQISTQTSGAGDAAPIDITAASVAAESLSNLHIFSNSAGAGAAGLVTVNGTVLAPPASTIVLDNSLVTATPLSGPNYLIPASDGKQVGGNLFESFSQFQLAQNESATFTGPGSVANVLVRVTGTAPAIIDGHLSCTIPGASFFLLDSAGIVFGPNAVLNVGSSLAASTANSIGLVNGTFSATLVDATALTSGPPIIFAFSGPAASISVAGYGSNPLSALSIGGTTPTPAPFLGQPLQLADGAVLSLVGGNISVQGRQILAPAGGINLISTASAGAVMFDAANPRGPVLLSEFATFGSVAISSQATLDVSNDPNNPALTGGRAVVRASTLSLDNSVINAQTTGGASAGIDIQLSGDLTLSNSMLNAPGGGYIGIVANNITLANSTIGTQGINSSAVIAEGSTTLAAAGQLSMTNSQIAGASGVLDGSVGSASLSNSTLSAISDTVPDVHGVTSDIGAPGIINFNASQSFALSGSHIATTGTVGGTNNSGSIQLSAGSFSLASGSTIDSSSLAMGGSITIAATGAVVISGAGTAINSVAGLGFYTGPGGSGNFGGATGGSIQITGATIEVSNGAVLSTASQGGLSGTLISLTANNITVSGPGTSITADTADAVIMQEGVPNFVMPGGNGGNIQFTATGSLQITGGASVSAVTTGQGRAGNITLSGAQVTVDNAMVSASTSGPGQAGDVSVTGGALTLSTGAILSSAATGGGNGGGVTFNLSGPILLARASSATAASSESAGGDVNITSMTSLSLTGGSSIAADAQQAGTIGISSPTVSLAGGSFISSNTIDPSPTGHAADLTVNASSLALNASRISAQTAGAGTGGNLTIAPLALGQPLAVSLADKSTITASTSAAGAAGNVTIAGNASISAGGGSAISTNTTSTGQAGDVILIADSLNVSGSSISSSSTGAGDAGSVTITAKRAVAINGSGSLSATSTQSAGGDVSVAACSFALLDDSTVSTQSQGQGGRVTIAARSGGIRIGGGSTVSAQSAGSGSIDLDAIGAIDLTGSVVTAQTPGAGGTVTIASSRSNLNFERATVSAQAGSLGNITLRAADFMLIFDHTTITARAATTGGVIRIDPQYVILRQSTIDGRAGGRDVLVQVGQGAIFLSSSDSQILSNNILLPPGTDVSAALIALPSTLPQINLGLAPVCAPRLEGEFSSFVITGQGSRPPQPDGWTPDLSLQGRELIEP